MQVQKGSTKQFTGFYGFIVWLARRISSAGTNAARNAARRPADLKRDVTPMDLDRYYATPGKAEWGC